MSAVPLAVAVRRLRPRGLLAYILRRLLVGLVVLAVVSVVVFAATQALPGNPAEAILGREATPQAVAALERELHLGRPVIAQYLSWIGGLLHGNPGWSLAANEPVGTLLAPRLANSGFLMLVAGLISIPLSVAIGVYAAVRRDRGFDVGSSIILLSLAALPEFVVGLLLVLVFATTFSHLLPATTAIPLGAHAWNDLSGDVLPVATLVVAVTPYVARVMRASMIEVLESEYVEMARLKGLPERTVLLRHALPNAVGPTFQVIAINLAYLAGGIVVVEYVFNFQGIGSALQSAVVDHDLPVVQAIAMLIAGLYVVLNLLADVATILTTPKLRRRL